MGREKPQIRRKKNKKARAGRLGAGLKHHLDAIDLSAVLGANNHGAKIYGAKLGARIYGAKLNARVTGVELPAKSPPRLRRAQELRVHILKSYLQGYICEFFFKKKAKK